MQNWTCAPSRLIDLGQRAGKRWLLVPAACKGKLINNEIVFSTQARDRENSDE
jgi:hypothetical protein